MQLWGLVAGFHVQSWLLNFVIWTIFDPFIINTKLHLTSYRGDSRTLKSKMEEMKASNSGAGSLPVLLCHGKGIYEFIIVHAEYYVTNLSLLHF